MILQIMVLINSEAVDNRLSMLDFFFFFFGGSKIDGSAREVNAICNLIS